MLTLIGSLKEAMMSQLNATPSCGGRIGCRDDRRAVLLIDASLVRTILSLEIVVVEVVVMAVAAQVVMLVLAQWPGWCWW